MEPAKLFGLVGKRVDRMDLRNQTVHRDLLGLSNTMSPIHRLSIVRGVPVVVICRSDKLHRTSNVSTKEKTGGDVNLQKITVSAAVRLIPSPPARVLRQNTKISGLVVSSGHGNWN